VDALLSTVAVLKAAQSYLRKANCAAGSALTKKRPDSLNAKLGALGKFEKQD
jgi:hypothetical protein